MQNKTFFFPNHSSSIRTQTLSSSNNPYLITEFSTSSTLLPKSKIDRNQSQSRLTTEISEENAIIASEMKKLFDAPSQKLKKSFIIIPESDLNKPSLKPNPYLYKPFICRDYTKQNNGFYNDFQEYLNGEIDASELIVRNNFPREN